MDVIKKKHWWQSDALKWSVLGLLGLLVGYLVVLMYAQGEYLFAITTLILSSAGLYIFANRKAYAWRYVYPEWLEWIIRPLPSGLHHRHCLHQLQQH